MGTNLRTIKLSDALFTKTQQAVLGLLFANVERTYHLRRIVRESGVGQGTVQRELKKLTEAGIILREKQGHQVLYRVNPDSPVFPELHGLIIKTFGIAQQLETALEELSDRIRIAFIYGSFARGDETHSSDIDLLIIGDLELRDVVRALGGLQQTLGREINPTVYPPGEYRTKLRTGQHFLTALQNEPRIFLIGNEDELGRLG
jgi:predicted nucleotidyltransferase